MDLALVAHFELLDRLGRFFVLSNGMFTSFAGDLPQVFQGEFSFPFSFSQFARQFTVDGASNLTGVWLTLRLTRTCCFWRDDWQLSTLTWKFKRCSFVMHADWPEIGKLFVEFVLFFDDSFVEIKLEIHVDNPGKFYTKSRPILPRISDWNSKLFSL